MKRWQCDNSKKHGRGEYQQEVEHKHWITSSEQTKIKHAACPCDKITTEQIRPQQSIGHQNRRFAWEVLQNLMVLAQLGCHRNLGNRKDRWRVTTKKQQKTLRKRVIALHRQRKRLQQGLGVRWRKWSYRTPRGQAKMGHLWSKMLTFVATAWCTKKQEVWSNHMTLSTENSRNGAKTLCFHIKIDSWYNDHGLRNESRQVNHARMSHKTYGGSTITKPQSIKNDLWPVKKKILARGSFWRFRVGGVTKTARE